MKNVNGFLPIALVVGDVRGYCVLSNHCHIQILDVSHDLLNGFVSVLPFFSHPLHSPISNLLSPSPLGRSDTQAILRTVSELKNNFPFLEAFSKGTCTILQKTDVTGGTIYKKNINLTIDKPENTAPESWESNSDPKGTHWPKMISYGATLTVKCQPRESKRPQ